MGGFTICLAQKKLGEHRAATLFGYVDLQWLSIKWLSIGYVDMQWLSIGYVEMQWLLYNDSMTSTLDALPLSCYILLLLHLTPLCP